MTSAIRRHPLFSFFVLAASISWILWLPLALGAEHRALRYLHFLGGLGPMTSALIVTRIAEGRTGLTTFLDRCRLQATDTRWAAFAVLFPIGLFVVSVVLAFPLFTFSPGLAAMGPLNILGWIASLVVLGVSRARVHS